MMTADEWSTCTDPDPMLRHLSGRVPDATFRAFVVRCCGRVAHLLNDPRSVQALAVGESAIRGTIPPAELLATREAAERAAAEAEARVDAAEGRVFDALAAEAWADLGKVASAARAVIDAVARRAEDVAAQAAAAAADAAASDTPDDWESARSRERAEQCNLLRQLI